MEASHKKHLPHVKVGKDAEEEEKVSSYRELAVQLSKLSALIWQSDKHGRLLEYLQ